MVNSRKIKRLFIPISIFKKSVFLLVFFVLLVFDNYCLHGQEIPTTFKARIDSLVHASPDTYQDIDKVLRSSRTDSILLFHFNKVSKKANYLSGQAYALNQLGRLYRDISKYPRALEFFQEALKISTIADNLEFKVYSLNMISVVYRRTDAIKSALDYSQEALELAETVTNPSIGLKRSMNVSLNNVGNIYQILEQYDLAIEKFERSIVLETELDNKLGLAINHQNLGECYEAQGELEDALKNFRRSLVYNEIIDSEKGKIICNYSIAHVYVHLGRLSQAVSILEEYLQRAIQLGDQKIVTAVYINYGWALIQIGDYDNAKSNLEKGLALAESLEFNTEIAEAHKFLYELYLKNDEFEKGLYHYKLSKSFEKRVTNSLNLRYVNDMILRYESDLRSSQLARLAEENESVRLRLRKNKTALLIVGIFLVLLIGILYILYRQSQLNAEKRLLTLEQSMLRSQMNPHFLFNSLNSIKLYIINNEKKNAVHYLNKFSKLVRKILEASSQKEITLAEELDTVSLYMNIENIRFSNEINFNIHVKDELDIHNIKIPSLILQPFLENALWHGLSSKEGEKNIDLEVRNGKSGFIEIIISDNGIGRDFAEKIKEGKVLKRKSVGIDITKERLANFSKDFQNQFNVEIIDKFDSENRPTGTQIVIQIPIF